MLNNESYRAASIASGNVSRNHSYRSGTDSPGIRCHRISQHMLILMSCCGTGVVKRSPAQGGNPSNVAGDNSSLQSAELDCSTIQTIQSQWEQELEAMVDKLSIENTKLKKSQKVALEAQRTLLKVNKEMAEQMHLVQSQLATALMMA